MTQREDEPGEGMEPMDPEIASLLERDRDHDVMPTGAPARVWSALDPKLGAGGGGEGGGPSPSAPASPSPASPVSPAPAAGLSSIVTHAIVLAIGAAAGAAMHAAIATPSAAPAPTVIAPVVEAIAPPPTTNVVEVPSSPVEAPPSSIVVALPSPSETRERREPRHDVVTPPPSSSAVVEAPEAPPSSSTLAAERVGLEIARTAIARGAFDHALAALTTHEHDYPSSRVAEEREVLFVRALAGAGRTAEAHERAARFRERYPNSLFLPAIAAL